MRGIKRAGPLPATRLVPAGVVGEAGGPQELVETGSLRPASNVGDFIIGVDLIDLGRRDVG